MGGTKKIYDDNDCEQEKKTILMSTSFILKEKFHQNVLQPFHYLSE